MFIQEALNKIWNTPKRHAIIMAPGGAGKSCLVKDLACDTDTVVPIFIDLSAANGDHYIFSEILREYVGDTRDYDDISSRKALLQLFNSDSSTSPEYRLILDGIDDAYKNANASLHTEINDLSKCASLQLILTVRSLDFLKTNYYFDQLKSYSILSLQLLPEEKRDSALKEAGVSLSEIAPVFLDILRRPMFLSVFLDLSNSENEKYSEQLTSARDLFSAVVSRDIDKQASQDGLYDKAEYAFHYLLPCLANYLNRVIFTTDELKKALYKSYLDTAYKCGAFDGISTDVITRAKQNYDSSDFPEFRQFVAEEIFQKYVASIFIPRGYIIKTGTSSFRFSHRNWLQYFQMEHMFNLMQRYDEDPSLSEIPALLAAQLGQEKKNTPYNRDELSKLILYAWENATDDTYGTSLVTPKKSSLRTVLVAIGCVAVVFIGTMLAFFFSRYLPSTEKKPESISEVYEELYPEPSQVPLSEPVEESSVDTLDFVLTPTVMTVGEYAKATEIIYARLETIADGKEFGYYEENNSLHIRLPKDALHDSDPYVFMKCYVSRPIELYLVDTTSWSLGKVSYDNIPVPRDCIESVTIRHGSVDGVNPAEHGFEGEEYPYLEITLTAEFAESCSDTIANWNNIVFAQDILKFEPWYYYSTFPQPDGRTYYLVDNSFSENVVKTIAYNFTHEPIAGAFSITHNPPINWEDPASVSRSGKNQVREDEITEDIVFFDYSTTVEDIVSGDWLDTNLSLKKRLDTLEQPYAIGEYVKSGLHCILIKTSYTKLSPFMPELASVLVTRRFSFEDLMVHGLGSYTSAGGSFYTIASKVVSEESGYYSLQINPKYEDNTRLTYSDYAEMVCTPDKRELSLCIGNLPFLTATPEDIVSPYVISYRHLYGKPTEEIDENNKWILNLTLEIVTGDSLNHTLTLNRIYSDSGESISMDSDENPYSSDRQRVIESIEEAVPTASVTFNGTSEIVVDLNIYVDEDLPATALDQVKAIYAASDFVNSRFARLSCNLITENETAKERARLSIYKRYDEGKIYYYSIFTNGRLEKYKDRYNNLLHSDPFFSELSRNIFDID